MWADVWTNIDQYLTSSTPDDGWKYYTKHWIIRHITEPVLEIAYACGIQSYKPMMMLEAEDLL